MKSSLLFGLFLSISLCCFAQKRTITGTIYDEDKNVLADANVLVKNSNKGTITNEKGQFTVEVEAKEILKVSYLGFETKDITIDNQKELNIVLKSQWEKMDPVVVVAYGRTIECKKIVCNCYYIGGCGIENEEKSSAFDRIQSKERLTSLFPNPSANGLFQLQLNKTYTKFTIEVFNMNGQLLQSNTYTNLSKIPQIDLSKQAKGIYLIRIMSDGKLLEAKKAIRS